MLRCLILCLLLSFLTGCSQDAPKDSAETPSAVTASEGSTATKSDDDEENGAAATSGGKDVKAPTYEAAPTEIVKDPEKARAALSDGDSQKAAGDYEKAADAYNRAMRLDPTNAEIPYKHALNYAAWGKRELVFESLALSADLGYSDSQKVSTQSEFDPYRENPRFGRIVKRMESNR
jgi:tetratricopeptide (TPR) repeat protein